MSTRNSKAIPIFAHPFIIDEQSGIMNVEHLLSVPKASNASGIHPLTFTGGLVSFISLPRSLSFGLGLTEALHVGPYQRDLASSPARIG